jgi:asparagine synthase (glutamine-hydrolysing)
MCGICGVIGIESREASEPVVRRMMAAMLHRGPDEEGILLAPPASLGMRRLSIIDLPGGSQPVWNEAGTLAIVYNGEAYNFRELRAELESKGHRFRTRSDTEVVLRAYEAWGEHSVERLHGMFAYAIVEMPQGRAGRAARVFLARDRMGIKPLYYTLVDGKLVFASEVRALLSSGLVPPRISPTAIPGYLLFGSVCEPLTLIDSVSSLPPGHSLTVAAESLTAAAPAPERYWDAPPLSHDSEPASRTARKTRALLEHAVESHLIADVPVGVFLSSGLDSTAVAALASRAHPGIRSFTVAFAGADKDFSEAEIARRTAARLKTDHRELTLSGDEVLARLDEAIHGFDQPSMDGINTYFVSWAARQSGLKVALSGLGSDELFGGYGTFTSTPKLARAIRLARLLPRPLRAVLAAGLARSNGFGSSPDAPKKALAALRDPDALPHPYFFTRLLFSPDSASAASKTRSDWTSSRSCQWLLDSALRARSMDDFTAVSWLEMRSYMLSTLLRDTDAMSMRHSLEVRVPFLDAPLVDYLLSLPAGAKRPAPRPKSLLIAALADVFPQEILAQRKRTFTFPWENWLRGSLGERVAASLDDWSPALAPCLPGEFARRVWEQFRAGETTWSRPWSLFILNEWVKRNVTAGASADRPRPAAAAIS